MTELRIKYEKFKVEIRDLIESSTCVDLNSFDNIAFEKTGKFMKRKSITRMKVFEFYRKECTYMTEEELFELLLIGKKRTEINKVFRGIKEAVKFKLICEINYELQISNDK